MQTYKIDKPIIDIIEKQIIDKDTLKDYIYRQVKQQNYSNYLKNVIYNNNGETMYEHYGQEILIDYADILNEGEKIFEKCYFNDKTNLKDLCINTWLIFVALHEMDHVKQNPFLKNAKNYFESFQAEEIYFTGKRIPLKTYEEYHEYFLFERIADFSALGAIFEMYQKTRTGGIYVYDEFVQFYLGWLKKGYQMFESYFKSPIEKVCELMNVPKTKINDLIPSENLSILERAEFGFPLTKEEYGLIKTKVIDKCSY